MKKYYQVLISSIITLALVGCGNSNSSASNGNQGDIKASNTASSEAKETVESAETSEKEIKFEEITFVDNDECSIKLTELDPDGTWGYTVKALLENKSADKNYMFSVINASINGVQSDPFFAEQVAPGKKSNASISFMDSSLEQNGITDETDIKLSFRVYDSDDWTADNVAEETVHVYPYGEENATVYERESQPSDIVLFDNEYGSATVIGFDPDSSWGYEAKLFLVNKTDNPMMFSAENVSVNGFMIDPFFATEVGPQEKAFSSMNWSTSDLEENDIETVENIEMTMRAYNSSDFTAGDYFSDTVSITPAE